MSRGDLYAAGSELFVYIEIADHRDLAVGEGELQHFSDEVLITLVIRVYCHCGIAEKSLRTGRGDLHEFALFTYDGVIDVPEETILILMLYLGIGDGSLADRAPVDDAGAFVDVAFLIEAYENFFYGFGTALVHRETLSVPVSGGTQLVQLIDDLSTVLFFPGPGMFEELLTADLLFVDALLTKLRGNFYLGSNGCVVGSRLPQCVVTLHSLITDQDILHRVVQSVAHMELTGYVWRRHYNGKRFLASVYFCMEVFLVQPFLVKTVFYALGIIGFCQFFVHGILSFLVSGCEEVCGRNAMPSLRFCFAKPQSRASPYQKPFKRAKICKQLLHARMAFGMAHA